MCHSPCPQKTQNWLIRKGCVQELEDAIEEANRIAQKIVTKTQAKFPKLEAKNLPEWFKAKRDMETYFKDHNMVDPRQRIKKVLAAGSWAFGPRS